MDKEYRGIRWLLVIFMACNAAIMFAFYWLRGEDATRSDLVIGMIYVLIAIMMIPIDKSGR